MGLFFLCLHLFSWENSQASELVIPKKTPFVWHPFSMESEEDLYVLNLVHRPLLQVDKEGAWSCRGCRTFDMASASRPIRFTLTLDPAWRWSDGKPISVEDFLLSWEIAKAMRQRNRLVASWQEVEVITPSTTEPGRLELQMARAVYPYHFLGAMYPLPAHQEGPVWKQCQKNIACYLQQSLFQTGGNWVSTGPYRMESLSGDVAILGQNPHFSKKPTISTIRIQRGKLPKEGAIFWPETAFPPWSTDLDTIVANYKNVQQILVPLYMLEQISFNLRSPLLRDIQVRKALQVALDLPLLVGGGGVPAAEFTHPLDPFFIAPSTETVTPLSRSEQARILLRQANWKENKAGAFYKQNRKLVVELAISPNRMSLTKRIQDQWRKIGVEVEIQVQTPDGFQQEVLGTGQFSGGVVYTLQRTPNYSVAHLFDSSREPHTGRRNSAFNLFRWSSLRMDQWIFQFDRMLDEDDRRKSWPKLEEMLREDLPLIPLYFHQGHAAATVNLQLGAQPPFVPTSMGVESWTLR